MTGIDHDQWRSALMLGRSDNRFEICLRRGWMSTCGFDIVRCGLHFRAREQASIRTRRLAMHHDWRRDIWIGACRSDPQHDLSRESRDCVISLADYLDNDSRFAGPVLSIDRTHALYRRDLVAKQGTRRNRDASRWKLDPELISVSAQIESRNGAAKFKMQLEAGTATLDPS